MLSKTELADACNKLHRYRRLDILGLAAVAAASIGQWHDVVYQSNSSYLELVARCGFSYQRSAKVFRSRIAEQLATFEEQLARVPALSDSPPDLNPQEMVWKATRAAVSHNLDERQLPSLAHRFEQPLSSTVFFYSMLEKYDHGRLCTMFN